MLVDELLEVILSACCTPATAATAFTDFAFAPAIPAAIAVATVVTAVALGHRRVQSIGCGGRGYDGPTRPSQWLTADVVAVKVAIVELDDDFGGRWLSDTRLYIHASKGGPSRPAGAAPFYSQADRGQCPEQGGSGGRRP